MNNIIETLGSIFANSLMASVATILMYLAYKWALADKKQHKFNRSVIYSIYVVGAIIPMMQGINISQGGAIAINAMSSPVDVKEVEATTQAGSWIDMAIVVLLAVYAIGVLAMIIANISAWQKLRYIVRSGKTTTYRNHRLVIIEDDNIAPFSWCNSIVMNYHDYEQSGTMILAHECHHIEQHHQIDLIIAQIFIIWQWYNPAAWLLRHELTAIHEYQADMNVLTSGYDARTYQIMLLKKAVGKQFPAFANSINHSIIKNRITMMSNKKTSKYAKLGVLTLVPAVALTIVAFNMPLVASAMSELTDAALPSSSKVTEILPQSNAENSENSATDDASQASQGTVQDVLPQYPGGEMEMYRYLIENMAWPSDGPKEKVNTMALVKFTVGTDGTLSNLEISKSSGYEALDREALRIVKSMPKWTPGISNGKPVEVTFNLPITFKTSDK